MESKKETLITSQDNVITTLNLKTGISLTTFKGELLSLFGSTLLTTSSSNGNSNSTTVLSIQKSKLVLPKITLIKPTNSKQYLIASHQSRLYIWNITTGTLVHHDVHYKPITCISISIDDQYIVTGSEDGTAHLYLFSDLLMGIVKPILTFTHSLSITSVYISKTFDPRIYTTSLDKSVKIWDFQGLLTTIVYECSITSITVNCAETELIVGGIDGNLYKTSLYTKESSIFTRHVKRITRVEYSEDETMVVSASDDGYCVIWDTLTRQVLRVVGTGKAAIDFQLSFDHQEQDLNVKMDRYPNGNGNGVEKGLLLGRVDKVRKREKETEVASLKRHLLELKKCNDDLFLSTLNKV